tara:strand:- start:18808 stop:22215 length:3408 start_codon:yes stop_codon:yes gene_type:complete
MKKTLFILLMFVLNSSTAQVEMKYNSNAENLPTWVQLMYADNPDEGEVINAYTNYYKENRLVKNKHTQYYKRWVRSLSRTTNTSNIKSKSKSTNQWKCIGPWDFDKDANSRSYAPGSAHVYTVEQSISNPNILYAGTATAGAWKTTDKGDNWNLITSNLSLNGVYSIEIDFLNPDVIYISGNGGIYKSHDSGTNWSVIGDTAFTNLSHSVKDIKLNPTNNLQLFVASDEGLFKSIDGGNNFTQIMSGNFLEIEFHPNSTDTMYFIKQEGDSTLFYRSDDGANSLTNFTNGWPNPGTGDEQKRTEIAVSPASPDKIVALATGSANGGSGLYGIYISNDKGENWTFQCCGPQPAGIPDTININMMGWQPDGSDDGGQYYYDLALAVNPTNADIIHVGGVNHWISTDGGVTFTCPSKWSTPHKKGYVHADIHDINYFGNDLWFACDGGVFYSADSGDSIYKKQYGIEGTDFWGFGVAFKDGDVMLGGTYHNGTLLKDGNTYINDWLCTDGGDNIRGFVNFGIPRVAYTDYNGKILSGDRTVDISTFSLGKKPNASYIIGESSQLEFDPRCYNWSYIGEDTTLWISKDNASTYSPVYHFDDKVTSVEVAWSNPDVIYVATWESWWGTKKIWRTNDAGQNWIEITPTNINGQAWIPYDITISSYDENTLWIARTSMYGGVQDAIGYEVFKSIDGGQSWINWSTPSLDNINATNIEHQRGSNGGVYLGTRDVVYYRNNNMTDWDVYDNNLPKSTTSTQLIPYYREGKLFNGTNRSAYEIDFHEDSPPSAQIAADRLTLNCLNDTVQFVDHSAVRFSSASWQWSFPGGTPSTSNLEDPVVVYSNPGTYDVTLKVTDAFGSSTQTIPNLITYTDGVFLISNSNSLYEGFDTGIFPPKDWQTPPSSYSWQSIVVDTGINCQPNTVAYVNHYWINQPGKEAYLISNKVKLGGGKTAENWLIYDYAYSGYAPGYDDGLRIEVSTDCGTTWDSIYGAIGTDLQTTAYVGSAWYPTCGSWDTDSINLSSWGLNGDTIMTRFVAINDYGNRFFMDNVKVNGQNILSVEEQENSTYFRMFPNPSSGMLNIKTNIKDSELSIVDLAGRLIQHQKLEKYHTSLDLKHIRDGFYIVRVSNGDAKEDRKLILKK